MWAVDTRRVTALPIASGHCAICEQRIDDWTQAINGGRINGNSCHGYEPVHRLCQAGFDEWFETVTA